MAGFIVDGSEIRRSPVDMVNISLFAGGLAPSQVVGDGISSTTNSMTKTCLKFFGNKWVGSWMDDLELLKLILVPFLPR